MVVEVRSRLSSPALGVMTFLNEVVQRYPKAISFAPGRPRDAFCDVQGTLSGLDPWVEHRARTTGQTRASVLTGLGQYGNTAGIILDLLAQHLEKDLDIRVDPSSIVVTTGCQEAMLISALTLLEPTTDTLLVSDPSYIGMTGVAQLASVPIHPVPSGPDGLRVADVEAAIQAVTRSGRRPRALYDVPDFNNPLGTCMPVAERRALLSLAERYGMLILEDNPYGPFAYDAKPLPTLKSLDTAGVVVYLGSFAKTLFPGLRVGYIVADQRLKGSNRPLAEAMTTVKSLTTVNTSPIMQAAVGAELIRGGGSLAQVVDHRLPYYRGNRDRMLAALEREFGGASPREAVTWNRPGGGFFIAVTLPCEFTTPQLERCAGDFGVIVSPMSYFALSPGRDRQARLSFSFVTGPSIDEGIRRFASFVRGELARPADHRAARDDVPRDEGVTRESPARLMAIVDRGFRRRGLSSEDASFAGRALVEASLRGVDTHGLRLLPVYLRELEGGRARPRPIIRWDERRPAVRAMDAGGALGLVAGRIAIDEAMRLAREHGVGAVSVTNSNHFGPASAFTVPMAEAGFIGIACSNSDALVAPFGGGRPALGTNPLSMAVLGNDTDLFCADFATSQVSFSRVKAYRARGWMVPDEWVATRDPSGGEVVLKPLGGYKGQCLGMMVELLSSVLSGSAAGQELSHFYTAPFSEPRGVSHFFLALDAAAFGDAPAFRQRVTDFLGFIRAEHALAPGDPEATVAAERRRDGVPLQEPEASCIRELLEEEQGAEAAQATS